MSGSNAAKQSGGPYSMTGFARLEATHSWGTIGWEVRSVNHRYLEPHFRLPELARGLEPDLRDALRKRLSRGKVEVSFSYQLASASASQSIRIDQELLQQLVATAEEVNAAIGNAAPVNPIEVMRWPGLIVETEIDKEELLSAATELFEQAIQGLIDHRQREGAELKHLIEQRLQGISEQVEQVRNILPQILDNQRQRLLDRLADIKGELNQDRLEQEMVYLAQKTDVDEELDRLDTHINEVRRALNKGGAVGRRLDFLMQELNREANTLSSKSIVSDTTQAAVEIKVLIEQMREQIQNME